MKSKKGKLDAGKVGCLEKLSKPQHVKVSPSLERALIRTAHARGLDKTDAMRQALATWVMDQGGFLPPECPENPARLWPEGSANHAVNKLIQEALPHLRDQLGDYAYERAIPRTKALLAEIRELDFKPLINYAVEKFTDPSMTPIQQVHYVEERLAAIRQKIRENGGV